MENRQLLAFRKVAAVRAQDLSFGNENPNRTPSEHPNPTTKIGPKMGGEFTNQPKWDPKTVLTPDGQMSYEFPTQCHGPPAFGFAQPRAMGLANEKLRRHHIAMITVTRCVVGDMNTSAKTELSCRLLPQNRGTLQKTANLHWSDGRWRVLL